VIASILENTYGCRKVTIIGACIAALGFAASSLYANIWFYYITIGIIGGMFNFFFFYIAQYIQLGFGCGLLYLPAIVSVNNYFDGKRSFAMGIAVCGSGLGTVIFPWLMPYIIHSPIWLDYNGALLVESAIIFICVIFGMSMVIFVVFE
jgi:MFS family permease